MARELVTRGYRVLGFLDRNKRGELDRLPCELADSEFAVEARTSGATLVLGLWNREVDIAALQNEFSGSGWQRVVTYPQWIELFGACIEPFWLAPREMYQSTSVQEQLAEVAKLWADEESQELFECALSARLNSELEPLNAPLRSRLLPQYFAPEIAGWPEPRRFIDCGAYDGDTLRELPEAVEAIAAFEPDLKNFEKLCETGRMQFSETEVLLWPCGVWQETTTLQFSGEGEGGRFDENGTSVPVVALDDVLQNFAPDFLKMDIEGAEYSALRGARRIIEKHRPALAICVYHRPEDLWRIPLLINEWNCGYEFFLRAHQFNGFDWVLYALSQ
jgi:FkbM family methyltransferase